MRRQGESPEIACWLGWFFARDATRIALYTLYLEDKVPFPHRFSPYHANARLERQAVINHDREVPFHLANTLETVLDDFRDQCRKHAYQ